MLGKRVSATLTSYCQALECKILTEVAGYGSQLGTIMDFVEVLARREHITLSKLQDNEQDACKLVRFDDLVRKINRAKGLPAVPPGADAEA